MMKRAITIDELCIQKYIGRYVPFSLSSPASFAGDHETDKSINGHDNPSLIFYLNADGHARLPDCAFSPLHFEKYFSPGTLFSYPKQTCVNLLHLLNYLRKTAPVSHARWLILTEIIRSRSEDFSWGVEHDHIMVSGQMPVSCQMLSLKTSVHSQRYTNERRSSLAKTKVQVSNLLHQSVFCLLTLYHDILLFIQHHHPDPFIRAFTYGKYSAPVNLAMFLHTITINSLLMFVLCFSYLPVEKPDGWKYRLLPSFYLSSE